MSQIIPHASPTSSSKQLDSAASELKRSRADVIRLALERYLEDFDDLTVALERIRDPSDPVHVDWDQVRDELLRSD